jgi:Na+/H+-dicarboxylate symporter
VKRLSLTTWSIIALAAGLGLGILGHETASPAFERLGQFIKPIGSLWVSALQLTVIPLVITHLLATVSGAGAKSVGKLGLRTLLLFLCMLLAAGLFAIFLTPIFLSYLSLDPATVATLNAPCFFIRSLPWGAGRGSLISLVLSFPLSWSR